MMLRRQEWATFFPLFHVLVHSVESFQLRNHAIIDMDHISISPRTDTWAIDKPIAIMTKVTIKELC